VVPGCPTADIVDPKPGAFAACRVNRRQKVILLNVKRSLDGIRLIWKTGKWTTNAQVDKLTSVKRGIFNDTPEPSLTYGELVRRAPDPKRTEANRFSTSASIASEASLIRELAERPVTRSAFVALDNFRLLITTSTPTYSSETSGRLEERTVFARGPSRPIQATP